MDYQVNWTDEAADDLRAIVAYLEKESRETADKVRLDILYSVDVLERFPFIGPLFERDPTLQIREILCHRYRIFYRVIKTKSQVEIIKVWHGSRQEPEF